MVNGEARHQVKATITIAGANTAKPLQDVSFTPAPHHVQIDPRSVMNTSVTWARMNSRKNQSARKWIERAPLPVQHAAEPSGMVRERRALHKAGDDRRGCRDEDGGKVGELLKAVVARPAMVHGERERQVLQGGRGRVRDHRPGGRYHPLPLVGREQQDVDGDAVERPKHVHREMPPARETDGMTDTRNAKPARDSHRIVLGGPDPARRNVLLETEPLGARRAVAAPIEPRVIGKDFHTSADDERHEEQVEEVTHPKPKREP